MSGNIRTVLALDFVSSHHATLFHHQISVWLDTVLPYVSPSPRGIYYRKMDISNKLFISQ